MKDLLVFKLIAITAVSFFGGFGLIEKGVYWLGSAFVLVAIVSVASAVTVTIFETLKIK